MTSRVAICSSIRGLGKGAFVSEGSSSSVLGSMALCFLWAA